MNHMPILVLIACLIILFFAVVYFCNKSLAKQDEEFMRTLTRINNLLSENNRNLRNINRSL